MFGGVKCIWVQLNGVVAYIIIYYISICNGICRGKGPGLYIESWALSDDTNGSEDKQIITKYFQTKSH